MTVMDSSVERYLIAVAWLQQAQVRSLEACTEPKTSLEKSQAHHRKYGPSAWPTRVCSTPNG